MTQYEISTDLSRIPLETLHATLLRLYACEAPPLPILRKAMENSILFAAYSPAGDLAGFVRAVTDHATFVRLSDAFVDENHRGCGVSKRILDAVFAHPALQGLPVFTSGTSARGFFQSAGFRLTERTMLQLFSETPV